MAGGGAPLNELSSRRRRVRPLGRRRNFLDAVATELGSPRFIFLLTIYIVVWIGMNWYGPTAWHWDDHDLLLLNLTFSLLSTYSGPLVLMAQNRQLERDAVAADVDRQRLRQHREDFAYATGQIHHILDSMGDYTTRSELREILAQEIAEIRRERAERDLAGAASDDPDTTI